MTWYACDLETPDLDFIQDKILSFAYYASPKNKGVLTNLYDISYWFESHPEDKYIWHNGKFDVKFLKKHLGLDIPIDWDTLLAESLLPDRPESLKLEEVAGKELGVPKWKDKTMYKNMGQADPLAVAS